MKRLLRSSGRFPNAKCLRCWLREFSNAPAVADTRRIAPVRVFRTGITQSQVDNGVVLADALQRFDAWLAER